MTEIPDNSIQLIVTSPPYPMIAMWDKLFCEIEPTVAALWRKLETKGNDADVQQIYDAMHNYLAKVWKEAHRVLIEGGIACINIGDATRSINGKFHLYPNHSRITEICEKIGFTSLPYILWKKPTNKPAYKGKGAFLGSGFLPPNAYVTLDCEFILIFRKGNLRKFPPKDANRYDSAFSKKQRDEWFSQIWNLKGTRQNSTELERRTAAYPPEIVDRLIRMFSVKGDTVLDPFLGSGTTTKIAMKTQRNSIGYEIDKKMVPILQKNLQDTNSSSNTIAIIQKDQP